MENLLSSLLLPQEADQLFSDADSYETEEDNKKETTPEEEESTEKKNNTAETELFDDPLESVGSGKNKDGQEDTPDADAGGASPKNFYSSIANALAEDGIFPNLDSDIVEKATDAEAFSNLIEAEINARLDEKQQRIIKALDNGVEATDIKKYENALGYLASLDDKILSEESEKGEQLRRNLIYQDFLNKGYSPDKARKFTDRTVDAGTDFEDAKEALQSNRDYFQKQYNTLLKDAEDRAAEEKANRQKQAEKIKESIFKDKQLLGDIDLNNDLRRKIFDNISKPVYKDPDTGQYLTALQKYEKENHADFIKYMGLFMTLTNGFKDFDTFTKGKVKKEMRKSLRELEQTLSNTKRDSNGNLRMVSSINDDSEAYLGKGFKLALD